MELTNSDQIRIIDSANEAVEAETVIGIAIGVWYDFVGISKSKEWDHKNNQEEHNLRYNSRNGAYKETEGLKYPQEVEKFNPQTQRSKTH